MRIAKTATLSWAGAMRAAKRVSRAEPGPILTRKPASLPRTGAIRTVKRASRTRPGSARTRKPQGEPGRGRSGLPAGRREPGRHRPGREKRNADLDEGDPDYGPVVATAAGAFRDTKTLLRRRERKSRRSARPSLRRKTCRGVERGLPRAGKPVTALGGRRAATVSRPRNRVIHPLYRLNHTQPRATRKGHLIRMSPSEFIVGKIRAQGAGGPPSGPRCRQAPAAVRPPPPPGPAAVRPPPPPPRRSRSASRRTTGRRRTAPPPGTARPGCG